MGLKKEIADILDKINKEIFYGEEEKSVHPDADITFEYSPGRFSIKNINPNFPHDSFMEITFSDSYKIESYKEKNPSTGDIKDFDEKEIKSLVKYGILTNFIRRDPRYVLANSKDFKKNSNNVYTMTLWDDNAKDMATMSKDSLGIFSDIFQYAELHVDGQDLEKMIIKTYFKKSGKERLFTDIDFHK